MKKNKIKMKSTNKNPKQSNLETKDPIIVCKLD